MVAVVTMSLVLLLYSLLLLLVLLVLLLPLLVLLLLVMDGGAQLGGGVSREQCRSEGVQVRAQCGR